jgi:hypothetical protein
MLVDIDFTLSHCAKLGSDKLFASAKAVATPDHTVELQGEVSAKGVFFTFGGYVIIRKCKLHRPITKQALSVVGLTDPLKQRPLRE